MWWIIALIALMLLLFVGEGAAGGFLDFVAACLKYGLPVGSVLIAIARFMDKKNLNGLGWIIAAIFWAWFFGWFR